MVRLILAPKSIEAQFIKRVHNGLDKGVVQKILRLRENSSQFNVCLCEDCRGGNGSCEDSVREGFESLFKGWNMDVHVVIHHFSFLGDELVMAKVLQNADLFYMSGVFSVPTGLVEAMNCGILMDLLQC